MNVNTHEMKLRGWVLYDGRCRMCRSSARRFGRMLQRRGFAMQPLQRACVRSQLQLHLPEHELLTQMRVLRLDGTSNGGADAILWLAKYIWWAKPLRLLASIPGGLTLLRRIYRGIADRRSCSTGACVRTSSRFTFRAWMPLLLLPNAAVLLGRFVAPWVWMWAIALSLYSGSKWLTWCRARDKWRPNSKAKSIGYLFAWPGMDSRPFIDRYQTQSNPFLFDWIAAFGKAMLGAVIVWMIVRTLPSNRPLLMGWVGMIGLFFLIHLGVFHVLALIWQRAGVNVEPIFRRPIAATSLGDFWGNRWNLGFHQLASDLLFRPLVPRVGAVWAVMAAYVASGLVHELVISLPAGAGLGFPTAYFTIQGVGMLAARSDLGRKLGLQRNLVGRMFTLIIVSAPAFWLFHPPFVHGVIVPFLKAIGAC